MKSVLTLIFILTFAAVPPCAQAQGVRRSPASIQHSDDAAREAIAVTFPQDKTIDVKLTGTRRLPKAEGRARVERKHGSTEIEIEVNNMKPASLFGGDFNTYVLWAVSPDGQVQNIGEFVLDGDHSKLKVSTNLNTFGMFVTAEPHYLVSLPSRFVVVDMTHAPKTSGRTEVATLRFHGYEGNYNFDRETLADAKEAGGPVETELKQAYTAVQLAERAKAGEFAKDELAAAQKALQETMTLSEQKKTRRDIDSYARETVRLAYAAQTRAEVRAREASLDAERRAREAELADITAQAEHATDEAQRARLEAQRREMQLQMEREAREAAGQRASDEARLRADAERRASQLAQDKAAADVRERQAQEEAAQAKKDREETYNKMRTALGQIAEIRESARGLIVNIPDVLFDFNKSTIRPDGRERLSKIAGIILATPGSWALSVEGQTDSVGSDEYNQALSEKRADAVRDYLVQSGVSRDTVTAEGFGKSKPIASNDTNEGRQRNRRVEIIIEDTTRPTRQH